MYESKTNEPYFSLSQGRGNNEYEDDDILAPNWMDNLAKATEGGAQHVFARDVNTEGKKIYTRDLSHAQMLVYQETQSRCDRNFYEIILDDKNVKLFYDIDISPALDNMVLLDQIINEILTITITSLKDLYNVDNIVFSDFAILDSSGEVRKKTGGTTTKTSVHIVLVNKVRFKSISHMKEYVTFVFSETSGFLTEKMDLHIDNGVYRKRGSLRIPGSTKRGQNRHLVIVSNHTPIECFLTYTDTDDDDIHVLEKPQRRSNKRKEDQMMRTMQSTLSSQQISNDDIFSKVVNALPIRLAENYAEWVAVGIKLYTAGANEDHWKEFSNRCPEKYNENLTHEKWLSFRGYGTGNMAALFRLLQKHNCDELVKEMCAHTLRFMGKYNNEIALGLARLYGDTHVFSKGSWYFYNEKKWILDEDQTYISRTIMVNFHSRLNREIKRINEQLKVIPENHPQYNEEIARLKNLLGIKEKTQSGRINSDWHALNVTFDQPSFVASLDNAPQLIGFENGVYDLDKEEFYEPDRDFRMTMSTGYDYTLPNTPKDIDGNDILDENDNPLPDPDDVALELLLHQIFPDASILDYMLRFLGSCLYGTVEEELIHFWTGLSNKQTGSNGKSTFVSLLLHTFGDYGACGHSSIITSRRESSNNSNSALMSLKCKRLVTFQEIDNENAINMPVIKALTGNDQVTGRHLFKSQETFTPQWTLVVCANKLPPVSTDDGGTQRRLRNIPFESKFVTDVRDPKWNNMPNIFPVDCTLKSKLIKYRMPLMRLLIKGYREYKTNGGLSNPGEKIKGHTNQYFQQYNIIYQFISTKMQLEQGKNTFIREILQQINNSAAKQTYTEEDIIDTCTDSFPHIRIGRASETDARLVMFDHVRNNEF